MDKSSYRDMCAAMAMQAFATRGVDRDAKLVAAKAFEYADAMANEREARNSRPQVNPRYRGD